MRGEHAIAPTGMDEWRRFIPACAGNTFDRLLRIQKEQVHPRMRGEHPESHMQPATDGGSSPHARGTRALWQECVLNDRFIPACAGNTTDDNTREFAVAVHPRMRGEHGPTDNGTPIDAGSSPHARGTLRHRRRRTLHRRFIPACAGNTFASRGRLPSCAVHPRMRGEHGRQVQNSRLKNGSSPHARGTRHEDPRYVYGFRFIPACAGNTVGHCDGVPELSVHPRMRGEHCLPVLSSPLHFGSSPHARGTRRNVLFG